MLRTKVIMEMVRQEECIAHGWTFLVAAAFIIDPLILFYYIGHAMIVHSSDSVVSVECVRQKAVSGQAGKISTG